MDGQRFDALAMALATRGTRRAFLNGIVGGLTAMVAGDRGLAAPPDGKGPKPIGKKCNKHHQCSTGYCSSETGGCACAVNADCDDGDPCTYDVCGNTSHQCFHDPIPDCQPCTGSGSCAGRCCPEGSVCGTNGFGVTTCCAICSDGLLCCDHTNEQFYAVNMCYEPCGFCCAGTARCDVHPTNGSTSAEPCILPGISR